MTKRKISSNSNLLKFFTIIFLVIFSASLIIWSAKTIFNRFLPINVTSIEVRPDPTLIHQADLDFLKNKNIFDVDLKKASSILSAKYGQFSLIRVYRCFPNKIIIELNSRERFAQIKSGQNFYIVDRDFVAIAKEPAPVNNLVEIKGVKPKSIISKQNLRKTKEDKTAVILVDFFRKSSQYPRVYCIDVSRLPDIKLVLQNNMSVIINLYEFNDKIKILLYLLPKIKQDLGKIEYIDLRFKEPVINYYKEIKK